jgi:hypothetical protein
MTAEKWADLRRDSEARAKDAADRGDYPYIPRRFKLEDAIRDAYMSPGTKFTLTAECRLSDLGGIEILATAIHVIETGTVIDPAP